MGDEALLDGLSTTWPYNLGDLYFNLQSRDYLGSPYSFVGESLMQRVLWERRTDELSASGYVRVGTSSKPLRTFYSFSRGEIEVGAQASIMREHTAVNLNLSYVDDPRDGDNWRLDGSYTAISYWNWTLALDQVERWWGPGWESSLILSNNARPFPAVSLSRNISYPFDLPVLRWLGNWTMTTFLGELTDDPFQTPEDPYLWGMRVEFKPASWLTIGLSRVAQWGGEGRPGGLSGFWDAITGNDNVGSGLSSQQEPGNQLAGYDFRLKPLPMAPLAIYGQAIGEDEAGYLPTKLMFLLGAEAWGRLHLLPEATWRVHVEYADTAARYHLTSSPEERNGIAYNHHIYKFGYRYKGLSLGDAMDGDSRSLSIGALISENSGRYWGLTLRRMELNRYDDPAYQNVHSAARNSATVYSAEAYGGFRIATRAYLQWALAYMDRDDTLEGISSDVQASTSFSYSF